MCTGCKFKQFPSFSHDIANTLSEMDAAAATMVFIVGSSHGYLSNKLGFTYIPTKENIVVSYNHALLTDSGSVIGPALLIQPF